MKVSKPHSSLPKQDPAVYGELPRESRVLFPLGCFSGLGAEVHVPGLAAAVSRLEHILSTPSVALPPR